MEGVQLDIFETLESIDQVQEVLQTQFNKLIKKYELNCKWETQNRVEYTIFFIDETNCTVKALLNESIVCDDTDWINVDLSHRCWMDGWFYKYNKMINTWVKTKNNFVEKVVDQTEISNINKQAGPIIPWKTRKFKALQTFSDFYMDFTKGRTYAAHGFEGKYTFITDKGYSRLNENMFDNFIVKWSDDLKEIT